jgi:hypothetical protein
MFQILIDYKESSPWGAQCHRHAADRVEYNRDPEYITLRGPDGLDKLIYPEFANSVLVLPADYHHSFFDEFGPLNDRYVDHSGLYKTEENRQ